MDTLTFEADGLKIEVRPHTGRDIIWWRVMFGKLDAKMPDFEFWREVFNVLVCIITQTVKVDGELGFTLPPPSADLATLQDTGNKLLDRWNLFKAWEKATTDVDAPANDPALLPPELLTDAKKKTKP